MPVKKVIAKTDSKSGALKASSMSSKATKAAKSQKETIGKNKTKAPPTVSKKGKVAKQAKRVTRK